MNIGRLQGKYRNNDEKIAFFSQWITCAICLFIHIGLLILFYMNGILPMLYYNIGSVTFYILALFYLGECPIDKREYATQAAAIEIIIHQSLCLFLLGTETGFQQLLIPTAAYLFLYASPSPRKMLNNRIIAGICIVEYGVACIGLYNVKPVYILPEEVKSSIYNVMSTFSFAILIAVVWLLSYQRNQSYKDMINKNAELEKLAKTKSDFLASMSHEIRTPLNVVIGMTELTMKEEISDHARENLEYIQNSGKSLLSIINDILDLSKMESGKMKIMEGDYSISEILKDVSTMMEIKTKEKKLESIVDIQDGLPKNLWGDGNRLRQVLTNLIGNATKFTYKGFVKLKVSYVNEEDICHITFIIEDTGIGIKQSDINRIFKEFEQIDSSKEKSSQGSGLGLSISKNLVELMGGKLCVESEYGKGSKFFFSLSQKVLNLNRDKKADKELTPFITKDVRALVVDDNQVNLKIAEGFLADYKMKIDQAQDGFHAIEMVKENTYDIIFMDHRMPIMDGRETLHRIRELDGDIGKNIPIIVLTASDMDESQKLVGEGGFEDVVIKPIDAVELNRILRKWLPDHKIE